MGSERAAPVRYLADNWRSSQRRWTGGGAEPPLLPLLLVHLRAVPADATVCWLARMLVALRSPWALFCPELR